MLGRGFVISLPKIRRCRGKCLFLYLLYIRNTKNKSSTIMSNEEKTQQDNMLQIEISPEVAQGTYANLAMIAHSTSEVILDFVCMMPGMPKAIA